MKRVHLKRLKRAQKRNRARQLKLSLIKALDDYFDALIQPVKIDIVNVLSEAARTVANEKEISHATVQTS